MKVLFVIAHLDKGGGQAVQARQLVDRLSRRVQGEFIGLSAIGGGDTRTLDPAFRVVGRLRFPGGIRELERAIRERLPGTDLVQVFDPYYALPAARLARARPLVVRLGAHPIEDLASRFGAPARIFLGMANPWLYADTQVVVNARHLGGEFGRRPVTFIPNGVDTSRFPPAERATARAALDLPPDVPIAAFTGKIIPRKNVEDLYWLAQNLPGLHVLLVGTDQEPYYGDRYHREVRRAFSDVLPRVHHVGEVEMERIPQYLAAADLFVFPSRLEGMPNSVLEAMAAGLPVIAADTPAHREVFPPGDGSFYVNRAALLARATALVGDPRASAEEGARNRRWVESHFSLEAAADAYVALYERVVSGASSRG